MGLEVTTEGITTGTDSEGWKEFQILVAAMLKLRVPNDVWTNAAERRTKMHAQCGKLAMVVS